MPVAIWTPRGWRVTRLSCPLLWTPGCGVPGEPGVASVRALSGCLSEPLLLGREGAQSGRGDQWSWLRVEAKPSDTTLHFCPFEHTFLPRSVQHRERGFQSVAVRGGRVTGRTGWDVTWDAGGCAPSGDSKHRISLVHLCGVTRGPEVCVFGKLATVHRPPSVHTALQAGSLGTLPMRPSDRRDVSSHMASLG